MVDLSGPVAMRAGDGFSACLVSLLQGFDLASGGVSAGKAERRAIARPLESFNPPDSA